MPTDRSGINAMMDRASSGDDAAFGALASAVQDELFRLALALGLVREDAADATQEALLRAYAGRARWRAGGDALAWLCGIVVNVAREYHRRRRRAAARLCASGLETRGEPGADAARRDAWADDDLRQLREAVAGLPPRQREAVACRYLRRMSIRDTAAAMGCAEGTVKSAVSAAVDRLRHVFERQQ